ncbi:DUF2637 domain-containing protein [Kineosporia sp. R_H_3]|uniref:DUF2637 domain-containing protein n=1 Tax=Kineosporia sp. R_H_3 TaxID=1961848 RepID=UPI000B4C075C|nr:DUF2637 domain-containing protein [Kineosporia sp. R_H_3]
MRAPLPPRRTENLVDQAIDLAIMVGLGILILVGFATSYRTLRDLAATEGGYPVWLAPAVPLSFDLGIVVLSLKVARAAREGRTAPVMRLLVAALSSATVIANAAAATSATARLLHAIPPAMFVVCFETVIISSRRVALEERGLLPPPLPHLRPIRWVLSFPSTWRQWRHAVLELDAGIAMTSTLPRSPVAGLKEARPSAIAVAATATMPVGDRSSEPSSSRTRDEAARELLEQDPLLSAPELARTLESAGWRVSARTAQRIRARLGASAAGL